MHLFTWTDTDYQFHADHLSSSIEKWIVKCPQDPSTGTLLKRQRRFAKYERELFRCGDDIDALNRFADAQIIAFRKIIKKYKVCMVFFSPVFPHTPSR